MPINYGPQKRLYELLLYDYLAETEFIQTKKQRRVSFCLPAVQERRRRP